MPVGPIVPGSPVNVTPDAGGLFYTAGFQAPTATMLVTGAQLQSLTLGWQNSIEKIRAGTWDMVGTMNLGDGFLGGNLVIKTGSIVNPKSGSLLQADSGSVASYLSGATVTMQSGSHLEMLGRIRRAAVVVVPDPGSHAVTLDITQGTRFELSNAPALPVIVTVDHTVGSPVANEILDFFIPGPLATGLQYTFKRNDATVIAKVYGNPAAAAFNAGVWIEIEFRGGVMRLGRNSGFYAAAGGAGTEGGVLPGAGA